MTPGLDLYYTYPVQTFHNDRLGSTVDYLDRGLTDVWDFIQCKELSTPIEFDLMGTSQFYSFRRKPVHGDCVSGPAYSLRKHPINRPWDCVSGPAYSFSRFNKPIAP